MIEISIIIPIYNAEKYLNDCIESILKQTFKKFEIILVDDGSTDSSGLICNDYRKKDSRIIYIHKENTGVSDSRNIGIDNAKGEWILFIDADDLLGTSDYLEKMYYFALNNGAKMPVHEYVTELRKNDEITKKSYINKNIDKNHIIANIIRPKDYDGNFLYYAPTIWGKLFSKKIIIDNHIYFRKDIKMYEDGLFMLDYVKYIDDVKIIKDTKYVYRIHNESAMHKFQFNALNEKIVIRNYYLDLIDLNSKIINSAIISAIFGTYRGLIKNSRLDNKSNKDYKKYININKDILNNDNYSFDYLSKGAKIDILIYKFCPFLLYCVSSLVVKIRK